MAKEHLKNGNKCAEATTLGRVSKREGWAVPLHRLVQGRRYEQIPAPFLEAVDRERGGAGADEASLLLCLRDHGPKAKHLKGKLWQRGSRGR